MAKYDPVTMKDWQIAEIAEAEMIPFDEMCEKLGIPKDERIPYGQKIGRVDYLKCLERLKDKPDGYYIDVTAITPTPLGEGKSTTSLGLIEGLGKRGVNVGGALRQPSGGPTMNIKGTAAGGGISLLIPMTEFSLGLTGDINNIMNAHNLAMVAATSRLMHEFNYNDEQLAKRNLKRLNIDPKNFEMGWVIDYCAQALRNIIIGLGGKMDGFMMASKFGIAVSSEVMAILSVTTSLADMKERLNNITVCYDKQGNPITTRDLEVGNAMTAWMLPSINPTLCQSVEKQPVFVHAGPFANIAVGQSSIIADQIGLKLFDYHVTESGFGADIGFEKFWNVKCRFSGLKPHVAVLTTTVRGLKHHGVNAGALPCPPGKPIPKEYFEASPTTFKWLEDGVQNAVHHIRTIKKAGIKPVVCINAFHFDSKEEHDLVRRVCEAEGARVAVSRHWQYGGEGALEFADAVMEACKEKQEFRFLYPNELPLRQRIEIIAEQVYGADGVDFLPEAVEKAKRFEADPKYNEYATMMVKTHLSLSHDPTKKGVPKGWRLPVRDFLVYSGAKFICPVCGAISLMPGTSSDPAFRRVDVDVKAGKVIGLF
jgi:formyltetrahydrofolate synthetase|uniref:Formate--tetrahydrofolate ligase n=1 Tax=Desulfobacca acetoxidans TaxID=60893 RepID=A0A7C3WIE8_9BACT